MCRKQKPFRATIYVAVNRSHFPNCQNDVRFSVISDRKWTEVVSLCYSAGHRYLAVTPSALWIYQRSLTPRQSFSQSITSLMSEINQKQQKNTQMSFSRSWFVTTPIHNSEFLYSTIIWPILHNSLGSNTQYSHYTQLNLTIASQCSNIWWMCLKWWNC